MLGSTHTNWEYLGDFSILGRPLTEFAFMASTDISAINVYFVHGHAKRKFQHVCVIHVCLCIVILGLADCQAASPLARLQFCFIFYRLL